MQGYWGPVWGILRLFVIHNPLVSQGPTPNRWDQMFQSPMGCGTVTPLCLRVWLRSYEPGVLNPAIPGCNRGS